MISYNKNLSDSTMNPSNPIWFLENITSSNLTKTLNGPEARWGSIALILIILATAVGNLLVCLAVCRERRLQNTTNYFLMSLAIADLLVSILVMPVAMVVEIYSHFPLDPHVCILWVTSDVLMCTASIWHMCTMSMDRYLTLKYPMKYGRNKTKTMVGIKILFVWIISIGISSPVCILGFLDISNVFKGGFCVPTISHFVIYGSLFAFYVPLLIMIITYVLTIWILYQNQELMKKIQRSDLRPCFRSNSPTRYQSRRNSPSQALSPPSNEGNSNVWNSHGVTDESVFVSSTNTDVDRNLEDDREVQARASSSLSVPKQWAEKKAASCTCLKTFALSDKEFIVCNARSQEWLPQNSGQGKSRENKQIVKSFLDVMSSPKLEKNTRITLDVPRSPSFSNRLSKSDKKKYSSEVGESTRLMPPSSPYHTMGRKTHSTSVIDDRLHQIEKEMDLCLKSPLIVDKNGHTIALADKSTRRSIFRNERHAKMFLDSGESEEESSSNNSDLISIQLHPEAFYLYKLDLKKASPAKKKKKEAETVFQNGHVKTEEVNGRSDFCESSESHETLRRKKSMTQKMRERLHLNKAGEDIKKTLIHLLPKKTATNEKKASKVLGIIFAVFVILWTPFFITNILSGLCPSCMAEVTPEVMSTFLWMGYVASLANPIIYTMFNTAFRRAFVKILKCQWRRPRQRRPDSVMMTLAATWQSDRRHTVTLLLKDDHKR